MITAGQSRAARAFLKWSLRDLAGRSGVAVPTISKFENGYTQPTHATLFVLRKMFEDAGIEFLNGDGVRFRPPPPE